jgi:lipoate-protein ligase A
MYFVDNQNTNDPCLNLALEEYLLRHVELAEPLLLLYVNEPAVIVGRNQNTAEEIDPDYVAARDIQVLRRLSGGGAVYHDLGNLNFSFIMPDKRHLHNYRRFSEPIIKALGQLGVEAEHRGKSDIFATGKKISGNAQYSTGGRMFSHGTLLFDSDLEELLKALNPRQGHIESRAVQSVRSQVTNIRALLAKPLTMVEFKTAMLQGLFAGRQLRTYKLSATDWAKIHQIAAERYQQWDWNYGRSPRFSVERSLRLPSGRLTAHIDVQRGRIAALDIAGDVARRQEVAALAQRLIGTAYNRPALAAALAQAARAEHLDTLDQDELLALLY